MKKLKVISGITANNLNRNANNAILRLNTQGYEVVGIQTDKSLIGFSVLIIYENGKSIEEEQRNQQFDVYNNRFAPVLIGLLGLLCLLVYFIFNKVIMSKAQMNVPSKTVEIFVSVLLTLIVVEILQNKFQGLTLLDFLIALVLVIFSAWVIGLIKVKLPFNLTQYLGVIFGLSLFSLAYRPTHIVLNKLGWLRRWYDE